MTRKNLLNSILVLTLVLGLVACSNKRNTFMSRQYHALTTHYNVYFNGKESLKEGLKKMEQAHEEDYSQVLPVFFYRNAASRAMANGNMDRVIEKASKAIKVHSITRKPKRKKGKRSDKYKEFRKKKEFNNWIDDSYLLLGKGYFFKKEYQDADKTFRFILREYPDSDLRAEAHLWLIRSLVDQEEFSSAKEQLARFEEGSALSRELQTDLACIQADLFIRQKQFGEAISHLQQAIAGEKKKYYKARYKYILAQLYQKSGQDGAASRTFKELSKMSFSYEMTFNARISRALSYNGSGNGEEIRKELRKMARDRKNKEYRDQIYYAFGEMDMVDENPEQAIDNYWLSTQKSMGNDNQKALSFLRLGEYYFGELDYKKSQMCYDSSMVYLRQDYPDYKVLSQRVGHLTELVNNLNIVEREDSLQNVARMETGERDELIAGIIQKIVKEEEQKRKEKADAMQDRAFFNQNNMLGRNSQQNNAQGNWYFYNPTTVGLGKSDFQRKWGRRKLEDNWRRKDKAIRDVTEMEQEIAEDQKEQKSRSGNAGPKNREYYLADLPLTDSLMQLSNEKIVKGLYQASLVYEEKLNNRGKALQTMEEMIRRFPRCNYLLSAYYHCFANHKALGNIAKAEFYKKKIVSEFPESDYAHALLDPNYYNKLEAEAQKVSRLYDQVYEDYQNFYYYRVIHSCDEALLKFPESNLRDRFLFLRAMGIGRTEGADSFRRALDEVLADHPSSEIRQTVEAILVGMDNGAIPVQYTAADMENARQTRLLRNWRFDEPTESTNEQPKDVVAEAKELYQLEPSQEHYFVLLFPKVEADPNRVLFKLSSYNAETYNKRVFKVDRKSLNEKEIMVVVKGLKGKKAALEYFNQIVMNEEVYSGLQDADYRNFVISATNYEIFVHNQDIGQYLNFYTKNYFDTERKNGETPVKKKGKLVAVKDQGQKDGSFKMNPNENHKFVLVVPSRKVNVNKLRADIFIHDKDFQVIKEPYDGDQQMIIVNNIGNRSEAMKYFRNIVADRNVFASLEKVSYRNFIISEENFESFYVNKKLLQYMDFFRREYLNDKSVRETSAAQEIVNEGPYIYQESEPHFFALVYPAKGVNEKRLEMGIKKYNTKDLKVEIRDLTKDRNILLVTNMRNKKQAMMYFRAVVTNRNLFVPVEKVDYRNFVISKQNLEVLMKDADPTNYMNFFKKWYLQ